MKKVLVLYYSQSGQLRSVVDSFISKLEDEEVLVEKREIEPLENYPYPWNFYRFADEFPEAVLEEGCKIK